MTPRPITVSDLREGRVPEALTGVEWSDGSVECRARVLHSDGSLVAEDDWHGVILTELCVSCDRCSDVCG